MANPTREVVIPIDMNARSEREQGNIHYLFNTPEDPVGIFSFSYYYRPNPVRANVNVQFAGAKAKTLLYVKGMNFYTELTKMGVFAGWKTIIYTDKSTLDSIGQLPKDAALMMKNLLEHPNVILAICEWPEYSRNQSNSAIDNSIIRVMRHKAMVDFPTLPVFVRDADTTFEVFLDSPGFTDKLYTWESTLLDNFRRSGKRFLVSTSPFYARMWHRNSLYGFKSHGILAGVTCSLGLGGIASELWQKSVQFMRDRYSIDIATGIISNASTSTYVGKDEQILIFIWIPPLLEDTFFFYFDYADANEYGTYITPWKYKNNPYHQVYLQLKTEFPQWINPKKNEFKNGFSRSPLNKISNVMRGISVNTPPAGEEPNLNEEHREHIIKAATEFEEELKTGLFLEEDRYLLNLVKEGSIRINSVNLLNPNTVSIAFRNPLFQRILYLMFKSITERYVLVASAPVLSVKDALAAEQAAQASHDTAQMNTDRLREAARWSPKDRDAAADATQTTLALEMELDIAEAAVKRAVKAAASAAEAAAGGGGAGANAEPPPNNKMSQGGGKRKTYKARKSRFKSKKTRKTKKLSIK